MSPNLPKLVVFDLDYTLWPFWVDTHVTPPFNKNNGVICDSHGAKVKSYPESTKVLQHLKDLGCDMAVASRTSEGVAAGQLIHLFGWDHFFRFKEMYPGCKQTHFERYVTSPIVQTLNKPICGVCHDIQYSTKKSHWPNRGDQIADDHFEVLGNVVDEKGKILHLYPDSKKCLSLLHSAQIPMAIASRISELAGAYQLLHLFEIRDYFEFIEIYPIDKRFHFQRLNEKSGIKFEDMMFYDDDQRNIRQISKLGVACVLVEKGLTIQHLDPILNPTSNV